MNPLWLSIGSIVWLVFSLGIVLDMKMTALNREPSELNVQEINVEKKTDPIEIHEIQQEVIDRASSSLTDILQKVKTEKDLDLEGFKEKIDQTIEAIKRTLLENKDKPVEFAFTEKIQAAIEGELSSSIKDKIGILNDNVQCLKENFSEKEKAVNNALIANSLELKSTLEKNIIDLQTNLTSLFSEHMKETASNIKAEILNELKSISGGVKTLVPGPPPPKLATSSGTGTTVSGSSPLKPIPLGGAGTAIQSPTTGPSKPTTITPEIFTIGRREAEIIQVATKEAQIKYKGKMYKIQETWHASSLQELKNQFESKLERFFAGKGIIIARVANGQFYLYYEVKL